MLSLNTSRRSNGSLLELIHTLVSENVPLSIKSYWLYYLKCKISFCLKDVHATSSLDQIVVHLDKYEELYNIIFMHLLPLPRLNPSQKTDHTFRRLSTVRLQNGD
jgi:hypothetical protein